jgi:hypothetical protein
LQGGDSCHKDRNIWQAVAESEPQLLQELAPAGSSCLEHCSLLD